MNLIVDLINRRLKKYGTNLYRQQVFRVVWSDLQTEKRRGLHAEFYGSLFVRETFGVFERKKYPYIRERWVLERWYPAEVVHHDDFPDSNCGSYEPLFVFQGANGSALAPSWRVVEKILYAISHPVSSSVRKSQLELEAERMKQEEYIKDLADLGGEVSWVEDRLHTGNAISLAGLKVKE